MKIDGFNGCRGGRIRTCDLPASGGTQSQVFDSSQRRIPLDFIFNSSLIASLRSDILKTFTTFQGAPRFVDLERPELCLVNLSSRSAVIPT